MPTFSREGEPTRLRAYLDLLDNADAISKFTRYIVPGELQTRGYARAVLEGIGIPRDQAELRAGTRAGRGSVLVRAGVVEAAIVTTAALRNKHVVGGNTAVMREQLQYLAELATSSRSPRLGIVTTRFVPLLTDRGAAPDLTEDVSSVITQDGTFLLGPDEWDVAQLDGTDSKMAAVAQNRQTRLEGWVAKAVYGRAAIAEIVESFDALSA